MRADALEHRRRLIEAAAHLFASQGPDTPLQAVIEEAGCGRGTLYRHFADRAELIMAVVEGEIEDALQTIETRAGDPALLVDALTCQSRAASIHFPLLCTVDEDRIQAFAERLRPRYERMLDLLLETARGCGQVDDGFTPDMLYMAIEMLGAARGSKAMPEDKAFALALRIVLDGVRQNPQGAHKSLSSFLKPGECREVDA